MAQKFVGYDVWDAITGAIAKSPRGKRFAAIAFLGASAPSLLRLRAGDVLVVNASDMAVRSQSTSPEAIEGYLNAGVRVYSVADLHAKVIATKHQAVIGSANVSERSRSFATEAVLITDSTNTVRQVQQFVQELADQGRELTDRDLPRLKRLWKEGNSIDPGTAVPGVNGGRVPLITDTSQGFAVQCSQDANIDTATVRNVDRDRRRVRRAPHQRIGWVVLDQGVGAYKINQVVYEYDDDFLYPPYVIDSGPLPLPDNSGRRFQWYRYASDHAAIAWEELDESLRAILVEHYTRKTYSKGLFEHTDGVGAALLDLWPEPSHSDEPESMAAAMPSALEGDPATVRRRPRKAVTRRR
ncbi:MAG: phospholipase D family protein [Candidatus Nanopelagicales bacterium]